jgi:N-acetyl-alpha-D-muramate 1-phosphate uridylyltransferase
MNMACVPVALLAGGLATRLRPISERIPKALVEVAGRPFVDHQLGDEAHGLRLAYSFDGERLLGTGGALRRALPLLGEVFWVLYGDSYLEFDYTSALRAFAAGSTQGLMTVLRNEGRWDRSNVLFQDGQLLRYDKHRPAPEMTYIDYGAALLRRSALEPIPPDEPYDLATLYSALVAEGKMIGYEVSQRFYEIGSHAGLAETEAYLRTTPMLPLSCTTGEGAGG